MASGKKSVPSRLKWARPEAGAGEVMSSGSVRLHML